MTLEERVAALERLVAAALSIVTHQRPGLTLEETEQVAIASALERHGGHQKLAAADLGISERMLTYKLLHKRKYQRRKA